MSNILYTDIKYLTGVGVKKAEILNKELNIYSIDDLLHYYPYKYIDRSRIFYIHEIDGDMPYIQIKGHITAFETLGQGRRKRLIAHFTDGTGFVDLVWFQGLKFITEKYKTNSPYLIFGKPSKFGSKINIAHPDIEAYIEGRTEYNILSGYYSTSEKMKKHYLNSKAIQKIIQSAISSSITHLKETLPDYIISRANLISLKDSIQNIHFPKNPNILRQSQYRLKFEELFYVQLNIIRYSLNRKKQLKGFVFSKIGDFFNTFYYENLPFELTNAQKRIIKEIRFDMSTGNQMNRLLQGDVGSGKTLVALMVMLIALDNGFQACLMAPTEILATQHYETIKELLFGLNVNVELLTGSTKKTKREELHSALLTKDINILIGTHALLENIVQFSNLGLVIIDEQHRFGVAQRAKLWTKNTKPPHILVMTATPIPRTLAMTVYGDLDVSVIDELPPGRKSIQTIHQYDKRRASLYNSIRKQLAKGCQIYIVYPLIEESEKIDLKNLEDGYKHICEAFPDYAISKVHGKMKPSDKNAEMQKFAQNETQIMVATTVIEVGVNVPNASVMVIESAHRFGLSQLHQLRGRVGRGSNQSYCILMTPYELSSDARKRIDIMVESNDGFEIADADLKLRGPGDLEGTQQSGIPFNLKIADIVKDSQIMQYARELAIEVINNDPTLEKKENYILKQELEKLNKNKYNWGIIS